MTARILALMLLTAGLVPAPAAADNDDAAALALADKAPETPGRAGDWRVFAEGALRGFDPRSDGSGDQSRERSKRLSLDARYDTTWLPGWRAVFADRVDLSWQHQIAHDDFINTLKEAYITWQPQPDAAADLGRINLRNGVASGYNPTDYFRAGAIRSVVSVNPASLKENRLGSVMLRGQTLWSSGSLSAVYSPKLADEPDADAFALDLGATNRRNRGLISVSQRLTEGFNPQFLLYDEQGQSPQLGMNLTTLIDNATVAYLEWSGGRNPSLLAQALALPDDSALRSRLATGVTHTTATKLSLTLEYQYDGAALDREGWEALRRGALGAYAQYRLFVQTLQEPPTREKVFAYALWQDAMMLHFDLAVMQRFDVADRSRLSWLEGRYHWHQADLALQWQVNHGDSLSAYGVLPERRVWQALVTFFF